MTFNKLPPKYAGVILLVSAPYYVWLWVSMYFHALPDLRVVSIIFFAWLTVGYFIVRAIFERMNRNWRDRE